MKIDKCDDCIYKGHVLAGDKCTVVCLLNYSKPIDEARENCLKRLSYRFYYGTIGSVNTIEPPKFYNYTPYTYETNSNNYIIIYE